MSSAQYRKKKQFLLGPYSALIHWTFEFVILSALPVLAAGAMFAVIDLLTGGMLSHVSPVFDLVWSAGQGAAIELLFFAAFMKVAQYASQGNWGKVFGWLIVGLLLAVPSFQASVVYGMVHTFSITVPQAISQLGLSPMEWIVIRGLAVIFIGALEGVAAYTPEGTQKSAAEIEQEAERKARIAAANAKLARARAEAYIGAGKAAIKTTFGQEEDDKEGDEESPKFDTDASEQAGEASEESSNRDKKVKRVFTISEARKLKKAKENGSVQARVFAFLDKHPNAPLSQIMEGADVGKASASKYKKLYRAENRAAG